MERPLSAFIHAAGAIEISGPSDAPIADLVYDSRHVKPHSLFFALPGLHTDGHAYIDRALDAGASCIVHSKDVRTLRDGVAYVRVDDPRAAMSPIADAFYGYPSRSLAVIGVTGTEGKSTTVFLIYQLLQLAGHKAGFISTVQYRIADEEVWNPEHQTTPEAPTVHRFLASMRDHGMKFAVVESSSHGLSPRTNRLGNVAFDVGVWMNVTHEHLEFHGTWEQYRHDKANLFRALDSAWHRKTVLGTQTDIPAFGVANADDPSVGYFEESTAKPVYTFSAKGQPGFLSAEDVRSDSCGNTFVIVDGETRLPARIELPGAFNVDNTLAAMIVVSRLTGVPIAELVPLLPRLRPVRGRMTVVNCGQPFEVIVDYAHTPSSFEAVFPPVRARAKNRMICVFGSGGERDTEKRPRQGRIASDYFDIVILADEDPRGEDPMALLEEIAVGCVNKRRNEDLFLIPDRRKAIRTAFSLAQSGDIVMLLGKGHENSIIYKDGPIPYDEIGEAVAALAELGFTMGSIQA